KTTDSSVTTPLERQFSTIAGLDSITSTNARGLTQITLRFNLSRNIDAAAQDVQAAIARAAPQLPPDMPTAPTYRKVNPADQPILYLALSSPALPLWTGDEYAQTFMAQRSPFPADYDDDHDGIDGHAANRVGVRDRGRIAAAARPGGSGGVAGVPGH